MPDKPIGRTLIQGSQTARSAPGAYATEAARTLGRPAGNRTQMLSVDARSRPSSGVHQRPARSEISGCRMY
jgi:hypothetical protein